MTMIILSVKVYSSSSSSSKPNAEARSACFLSLSTLAFLAAGSIASIFGNLKWLFGLNFYSGITFVLLYSSRIFLKLDHFKNNVVLSVLTYYDLTVIRILTTKKLDQKYSHRLNGISKFSMKNQTKVYSFPNEAINK